LSTKGGCFARQIIVNLPEFWIYAMRNFDEFFVDLRQIDRQAGVLSREDDNITRRHHGSSIERRIEALRDGATRYVRMMGNDQFRVARGERPTQIGEGVWGVEMNDIWFEARYLDEHGRAEWLG
jgi:hypothetical protein